MEPSPSKSPVETHPDTSKPVDTGKPVAKDVAHQDEVVGPQHHVPADPLNPPTPYAHVVPPHRQPAYPVEPLVDAPTVHATGLGALPRTAKENAPVPEPGRDVTYKNMGGEIVTDRYYPNITVTSPLDENVVIDRQADGDAKIDAAEAEAAAAKTRVAEAKADVKADSTEATKDALDEAKAEAAKAKANVKQVKSDVADEAKEDEDEAKAKENEAKVAKPDATKSEPVKPEAPKPDVARSEPSKVEPAKFEAPKPDVAKPDAAKIEAAKPKTEAKPEPQATHFTAVGTIDKE